MERFKEFMYHTHLKLTNQIWIIHIQKYSTNHCDIHISNYKLSPDANTYISVLRQYISENHYLCSCSNVKS